MHSWLRLPLILHLVAFGLPASLAQAEVEDFPPELDDLRMNEVQLIGSHNSYHIQPDAVLDSVMVLVLADAPVALDGLCPGETVADNCVQRLRYTHPSLDVQLGEMGIRQFELDVFAEPLGFGMQENLYQYPFGWHFFLPEYPALPGMPFDPALAEDGFKVFHVQDIDFRSTCYTLVACLTTIRDWSLANPRHIPILVLIEVKDDRLPEVVVETPPIGVIPWAVPEPFSARMFRLLEAEIRSVFGEDHLLTPDDVRGGYETLREAVLTEGWPTLLEASGKVYFALDNGGSYLATYLSPRPSLAGAVMFTSSPPESDEAAFMKRNDPYDLEIPGLVEDGFLVRTRADVETQEAIANDTARRDQAFASGAHFVSTDYRDPDLSLSPYQVAFEGDTTFRCNPINTTEGCSFAVPEPHLALLEGVALLALAWVRQRSRTAARLGAAG
ncbi:MAG: Ca2+-dependent phosphoinositide-specific phospholipase C [Myxococcota bacterium]